MATKTKLTSSQLNHLTIVADYHPHDDYGVMMLKLNRPVLKKLSVAGLIVCVMCKRDYWEETAKGAEVLAELNPEVEPAR